MYCYLITCAVHPSAESDLATEVYEGIVRILEHLCLTVCQVKAIAVLQLGQQTFVQ